MFTREHLRPATREEALGDAVMNPVMRDMHGALSQSRSLLRYVDLRRRAAEDLAAQGAQEGPEGTEIPVEPVIAAMNQQPAAHAPEGDRAEPQAEPMAGTPPLVASLTPPGNMTPVVEQAVPAEAGEQRQDGLNISVPKDIEMDSVSGADGEDANEALVLDTEDTDMKEALAIKDQLQKTFGLENDLDMEKEFQGIIHDVFELRNKAMRKGQKGKELDPRYFDGVEWDKFRDADEKQWKAHLNTGAVRLVPPKETGKIPRHQILPIPSRMVRTNQSEEDDELIAKSRLVVPGHLAPEIDGRTDAPVALQVFFYILMSYAVNLDWEFKKFDVKDAFLSGKENFMRKLYVRPPKEGIRGIPEGSLIEIIKGVFGLPESPRLFWLLMKDEVIEAGFEPLKYAPGCFVVRGKGGKLEGMLGVHVDDGLWGGKGPAWQKATANLRKKLDFKHELEGQFEFLGRRVTQTQKMIVVDQFDYVKNQTCVHPSDQAEAATIEIVTCRDDSVSESNTTIGMASQGFHAKVRVPGK